MKPTPICIVARRIQRLSLAQQIHHVQTLVTAEKPRSIRREELLVLLRDLRVKQLKREARAA